MDCVKLIVGEESFIVKRQLLVKYCDYFRAMFSGNYVEGQKDEITLTLIDPVSMRIVIKFVENGDVDLKEYSLPVVKELANASVFLQVTELLKLIKVTLEQNISPANFMDIMDIAENTLFKDLEQTAATFGLLSFHDMIPDYVPSMEKLVWYLSHPNLEAHSEMDVFNFGFNWLNGKETGVNSIFIILGCLDIKKLTSDELLSIKILISSSVDSLPVKVIDCLLDIKKSRKISTCVIQQLKDMIESSFTPVVYDEVFKLVLESTDRMSNYKPIIPLWIVKDTMPASIPHCLYTFTEKDGFVNWLKVAEMSLWGWSVVNWGSHRLVIVNGENGKGSGIFERDVKIYDTFTKKWTNHGVELPAQRHVGAAIIKDNLYMVGGVGSFRVVQDQVIVYNLIEKTYKKLAKFPEALQSPAVCNHENTLYACGTNTIYRYEDLGDTDRWTLVIRLNIRPHIMVSYKGFIYITQNFFNHFYRIKTGVETELTKLCYFTYSPAAVCVFGNRILAFTRTMCGQSDIVSAEEYKGISETEEPNVVWIIEDAPIKINDVAGCCTVLTDIPPLKPNTSKYATKYLEEYYNYKKQSAAESTSE